MVCIPESFEGLLADAIMSCRIYKQHAEKHDVTGDSSCLGVVDLDRCFRSKLLLLDVIKAKSKSDVHMGIAQTDWDLLTHLT